MAKNPSRADRFAEALGNLNPSIDTLSDLKDELEQWRDNLPENLQNGSKADQLNEAIDELDSIISDLQDIEGRTVEFPGMFS